MQFVNPYLLAGLDEAIARQKRAFVPSDAMAQAGQGGAPSGAPPGGAPPGGAPPVGAPTGPPGAAPPGAAPPGPPPADPSDPMSMVRNMMKEELAAHQQQQMAAGGAPGAGGPAKPKVEPAHILAEQQKTNALMKGLYQAAQIPLPYELIDAPMGIAPPPGAPGAPPTPGAPPQPGAAPQPGAPPAGAPAPSPGMVQQKAAAVLALAASLRRTH